MANAVAEFCWQKRNAELNLVPMSGLFELLCSETLLLSAGCLSYSISIKYRLHSHCVITVGPAGSALLMLTFKLLVFL